MADDGDEGEDRVPSRPMSAMGIEIEPDLEAPLLGTLQESSKPPSRVAPLLVLLAFILVVIALASMMGNLSSHIQSISPASAQPP